MVRNRIRVLLIVILAGVGVVVQGTAACAQTLPSDKEFLKMIPVDYANGFLEKALQGIHYLNCDGVPCKQTDEFELLNPPLSNNDTRMVMVFGIKGALSKWCGLDGALGEQELAAFADDRGLNARQRALAAAVFGTFMRLQWAVYDNSSDQCSAETKEALTQALVDQSE